MTTKPDQIRLEALCQGVAAGLSDRQAAIRAGYSARSNWYRTLLDREQAEKRIAFLKRVNALVRDGLAPLIFALQDVARTAAARDSDPGLAAAVRALTEAGRMLEKLPAAPAAADEIPDWAQID